MSQANDLHIEPGFTWLYSKAANNLAKHKISFDEAKLIFDDRGVVDLDEDRRFNYAEQRFNSIGRCMVTMGKDKVEELLIVSFFYNDDESRHLLSARKVEKNERAYWLHSNADFF